MLRAPSYTAYNGVGVHTRTRLRSFILWRRGLDGKRPGFYGEPRHLTGLPPSSSEIFNSGRLTSPRKRSTSPRVPFRDANILVSNPLKYFNLLRKIFVIK